ncbi:MAG: hypothetical protein ACKO96_23070 [Flammeovirgaceae bacterium]
MKNVMWYAEEEEQRIKRNFDSLYALAKNYGVDERFLYDPNFKQFLLSIARAQAIAYLKQRAIL